MPGRLQKVAALVAVAWGFAGPSLALEPMGAGASLAAVPARDAALGGTVLELSESNAIERWSLRAGSYRGAWDPADIPFFPRFDWRSALAGEVARANLAFDWQRRVGTGRIEGAAFGRLARTDVGEAAHAPNVFEQRLRESAFGASLRWSDASLALTAGVRGTGRDAQGGMADERGGLAREREDRLDESVFTLGASTDIALPGRIRAQARLRYETYRGSVRSDLAANAGAAAAQALLPQLRLRAPLPFGGDMFLTLGRGIHADRGLAALTDPRTGAPVARLDPLATTDTVEIGFRRRLPPGIEATVSMFRAATDLELLLTGENAITEFSRPTVRRGVQLAARYEPASWLTLDFQATALHARFADGAAEYVPGAAERNASAAATVRVPYGWSASLRVNYLGKRSGIDETASLRASTFVNGRLTRNLSKATRVTLDVFNVFDQRLRDVDYFSASRMSSAFGAADSYLFNPAEPRGFRLKLRTTF